MATNRDRVVKGIEQTMAGADEYNIEPEILRNTMLGGIMAELAGLNDELHALNLKIDKLTKEVGKRK